MCSAKAPATELPPRLLADAERALLLDLARRSIAHGLDTGRALPVALDGLPPVLAADGAAFVTLLLAGRLRGCIGHLEPVGPLAVDVSENAYAAAFRDPRFPPVRAPELDLLHVEVSVLTPSEPIAFGSEEELLAALRPGIDGVILAEGARRGTFLPSVWEQLPEPAEFLRHLKLKAGLAAGYWSPRLTASRYRTESFGE